jgi:uncharacterized membrane protein YbhN (UPF0104 family)
MATTTERRPVDDAPPEGLDTRRLLKGALRLLVVMVVIAAVVIFLPGLGEVRERFDGLDTTWVIAAVVAELLSCISYVLIFKAVFARNVGWVRSGRLALAELAVVALLPVGGIGGLALGAWVMRRHGVSGETVARRSVAFFLLTSAVNFAAVVLIGALMGMGLLADGGEQTLSLVLAAGAAALVVVIPLVLLAAARMAGDGKLGVLAKTLGGGVTESRDVLRRGGWMAWSGAVGYWAFDTLALWFCLKAIAAAIPIGSTAMGHLIGMLGSLIPIPGGIGGVDGGLVGSLIAYSAEASAAVAAVLAFRVVNSVVRLLVGAPALIVVLSREAGASTPATRFDRGAAEEEELVAEELQACRRVAVAACDEEAA